MGSTLHRLPRWPCRFAALGTLALAGVLLVAGCAASKATMPDSPPEAPPDEVTEEDWPAAVARAEAATFLAYSDYARGDERYGPGWPVAFYIGNDEWVSSGLGSLDPTAPVSQWALGREAVQYDFTRRVYLDRDGQPVTVQPVTVIGRDPQTGLSLLRASGDGVTPLRFATDLPPPCTPLRLIGYWGSPAEGPRDYAAEARTLIADCAVATAPGLDWPLPPEDMWEDEETGAVTPLVPATAGTTLATVFTDGEIPYLLLHRSEQMDDWVVGEPYSWDGAPVIDAAGAVVGVRSLYAYYQAVAAPAVIEALARIREDAAARAQE